jgi:hypothetical protein
VEGSNKRCLDKMSVGQMVFDEKAWSQGNRFGTFLYFCRFWVLEFSSSDDIERERERGREGRRKREGTEGERDRGERGR